MEQVGPVDAVLRFLCLNDAGSQLAADGRDDLVAELRGAVESGDAADRARLLERIVEALGWQTYLEEFRARAARSDAGFGMDPAALVVESSPLYAIFACPLPQQRRCGRTERATRDVPRCSIAAAAMRWVDDEYLH